MHSLTYIHLDSCHLCDLHQTREKCALKNKSRLDEFHFYVKHGNMLGDLSSLSFQNLLIIKLTVKFEKEKKRNFDSLYLGVAQGWDGRHPAAQDRVVLPVWCGKAGMALAHAI